MDITQGHVLWLAGPQLLCLPWAGASRLQSQIVMCTERGSKQMCFAVPASPLSCCIILGSFLTSLKLSFSIYRAQLIKLATSQHYIEDSMSSNMESMFRALYIVRL